MFNESILSEFQNYSNSDYRNKCLTFNSEYQKLTSTRQMALAHRRKASERKDHADQLASRTLRRVTGVPCQRHVLCRSCRCDQCQVRRRLFAQCHDRPRETDGAGGPRPAKRLSRVPQESKSPRPRQNQSSERAAEAKPEPPIAERPRRVELRCVQIMPRHLAVMNWKPAIAGIPMVATPTAKPSRSAVIPSARVRATASDIST